MEDWTDIIRDRLQYQEARLPSDDWEVFESKFLSNRRRRRLLTFSSVLLTTAAAAAIAFLFLNRQTEETIIKQVPASSTSPSLLSSENTISPSEEITTVPSNPAKPTAIIPLQTETSVSIFQPEIIDNEEPDRSQEEGGDIPQKEDKPEVRIKEHNGWDRLDDALKPGRETRKRIAVTPHINGLKRTASVDNSSVFGQPAYSTPGDHSIITAPGSKLNADHSLPLTFGINVSYPISDRLGLTSGIELSSYRSKFTFPTDGTVVASQTARYLGIPLKIEWTALSDGRFSAWLGAGGKVDRCVFARYGDKTVRDNRFNWSAIADVSVQYAISDNVGIFIAPEVSWFFKQENPALLTYRTENPLMFTIGAGLRFSL